MRRKNKNKNINEIPSVFTSIWNMTKEENIEQIKKDDSFFKLSEIKLITAGMK